MTLSVTRTQPTLRFAGNKNPMGQVIRILQEVADEKTVISRENLKYGLPTPVLLDSSSVGRLAKAICDTSHRYYAKHPDCPRAIEVLYSPEPDGTMNVSITPLDQNGQDTRHQVSFYVDEQRQLTKLNYLFKQKPDKYAVKQLPSNTPQINALVAQIMAKLDHPSLKERASVN